jgi:amidohydrolase
MDRETLKRRVVEAIERRAGELIEIARYLLANPEIGYREVKAAALVADTFGKLGLPHRTGLALTGVRADLGKRTGPTVAVLGELDGLVAFGHPHADPETGIAHTCGHNAQIATMLGVAMGLVDSNAMDHLAGRVVLFAVPAEEYVDLAYRAQLRDSGRLEFFGGKPELVRLGHFDDVDMAMMVHASANTPERRISVGGTTNGFLAKTIRFHGKAAHAGARPDLGVNALNVAALAIMGINAQRETFRDEDAVRVHHILTAGGHSVNVVPEDVRMELFARGRSLEAIRDAGVKVNRALAGAAQMVGARVEIDDLPGYLPLLEEPVMANAFRHNAATVLGGEHVLPGRHVAASTDMGDLSHLMPALHPFAGGYRGTNHSRDFLVADEEMAYVLPAKMMAMTVVDLLHGDAAEARRALETYTPRLNKAEYLGYLRGEA